MSEGRVRFTLKKFFQVLSETHMWGKVTISFKLEWNLMFFTKAL